MVFGAIECPPMQVCSLVSFLNFNNIIFENTLKSMEQKNPSEKQLRQGATLSLVFTATHQLRRASPWKIGSPPCNKLIRVLAEKATCVTPERHAARREERVGLNVYKCRALT